MSTKAQREAAAAKRAEQEALEALAALTDEERATLAELSEEEVAALMELADQDQETDEDAQDEPETADEAPAPLSPIERLDAARAALGVAQGLYSAGKASQSDVDEAQAEVDNARAAIRG